MPVTHCHPRLALTHIPLCLTLLAVAACGEESPPPDRGGAELAGEQLTYPFASEGHVITDDPDGHASRTNQRNWDLDCVFGDRVGAMIAGTVESVENSLPQGEEYGYGNRVCVHSSALDITICHNHLERGSVSVQVGCEVAAGDEIGGCGNSGYVIGDPGTHLDVYAVDSSGANVELPHPDTWGAPAGLAGATCGGGPGPDPMGCPDGDGRYCGNNPGIAGEDGVLYDCQDGTLTPIARCVESCAVADPGSPDVCTGACPSGNGAYCGGTLGLDAETLYDCRDGEATVIEACDAGCFVAEPGTADHCN